MTYQTQILARGVCRWLRGRACWWADEQLRRGATCRWSDAILGGHARP